MSAVDLAAVAAALGEIAPAFSVGPVDIGGGRELLCLARDHAAESLQQAKERLERAGLSSLPAGGRLYVASPAVAAASARAEGPWSPGWYEQAPRAQSRRAA